MIWLDFYHHYCIKVNLLLWRSHLLFSEQNFAQSAESLLQDCRRHCATRTVLHTDRRVLAFMMSFWHCIPGDDESSACAGLNTSSCADLTGSLNAQRRDIRQTVDVTVNADNAALPVFSSHVHQHHNIPKVQISIVCHRKVHLHMWTNVPFSTVITVIVSALKCVKNELKLVLPAVKCSVWGGLLSEQQVHLSPFSPNTLSF